MECGCNNTCQELRFMHNHLRNFMGKPSLLLGPLSLSHSEASSGCILDSAQHLHRLVDGVDSQWKLTLLNIDQETLQLS